MLAILAFTGLFVLLGLVIDGEIMCARERRERARSDGSAS